MLFADFVVTPVRQTDDAPPPHPTPATLMNDTGPAHCTLVDKGRCALGATKGTKGVPGGWVANEPGLLRAGGGTPSLCDGRRHNGVLGRIRGRGHAVPGSTNSSAARVGLGIGGGPACRGAEATSLFSIGFCTSTIATTEYEHDNMRTINQYYSKNR